MLLSFDYRHVDGVVGGPNTPRVPVKVLAPDPGRCLEGWALLDTGSSLSSIPIKFMDGLGIAADECRPSSSNGVGGSHRVLDYPGGLEAHVGGYRVQIAARFHEHGHGLILGAEDFLRWFRATFDTRDRVVRLKPYADTPRVGSTIALVAPPTALDVAPLHLLLGADFHDAMRAACEEGGDGDAECT